MLVERSDVGWVLWCRLRKGWPLQEVNWGLSGSFLLTGWTESRSPEALEVLIGWTALVICGMGSPAKEVCHWRVHCLVTTGGLVAPGVADTSASAGTVLLPPSYKATQSEPSRSTDFLYYIWTCMSDWGPSPRSGRGVFVMGEVRLWPPLR
jgi:hypothetical protein